MKVAFIIFIIFANNLLGYSNCSNDYDSNHYDSNHYDSNHYEWKPEPLMETNDLPNIKFYVALKQDVIGVQEIEDIVLNDISNIDSPLYGNFLDNEFIMNKISPPIEVRNYIINEFSDNNIICDDLGDALKCEGSMNDINKYVIRQEDKYYIMSTTPFRMDIDNNTYNDNEKH